MHESQLKNLSLDMVPEGTCRDIAAEIGVENFFKLSTLLGGEVVYIPKNDALLRALRDAEIRQEYSGYNKRELCRKYKISVRRLEQIISRDRG